jgi:hypothetical protein
VDVYITKKRGGGNIGSFPQVPVDTDSEYGEEFEGFDINVDDDGSY